MPPRIPIPRLTLFTGGKECSLCDVAKHELDILRQTVPFELRSWNIRDPPKDVDGWEAKKWRRLYQYDIVAGAPPRGEPSSKASDRSGCAGESHQGMASAANGVGSSQGIANIETVLTEGSSFRPYRSILAFASPSVGVEGEIDHDSAEAGKRRKLPPWRRPVGDAFFAYTEYRSLPKPNTCRRRHRKSPVLLEGQEDGEIVESEVLSDSSHHDGDDAGILDWEGVEPKNKYGDDDKYIAMLERTFRNFSEQMIGWDQTIVDVDQVDLNFDDGQVPHLVLDDVPMRGWVEGAQDVEYDARLPPAGGGAKANSHIRSGHACWNCRQTDHQLRDCPYPRDNAQIALSREEFQAARDAIPAHAMEHLQRYSLTAAERDRRLALIEDYNRPGPPSSDLQDAVFYLSEEEDTLGQEEQERERAMLQRKRERREWPWLVWIAKWGYPPGWIAGNDPMEEVKRRLLLMPIVEAAEMESDSGSVLDIYDDDFDALSDMSMDVASGDAGSDTEEAEGNIPASATIATTIDIPQPHASSARLTKTTTGDLVLARSALQEDRLSCSPPPGPPESPPPPPPPDETIPPPPPLLPPLPQRWADYETNLFSSELLQPYSPARPLPLGW